MEAGIFKNETEGQYSRQSYQRSQNQLHWFTEELARMNLVSIYTCITWKKCQKITYIFHKTKKLISKHSKKALAQFLSINAQLVHFKHFQSLNQTAMIKILKKHDKRTSLR